MARRTIDPKKAPILWSTIDQAFEDINLNFTELYATVGGPGGVVDFGSLPTDVIPSDSGTYDIGSPTKRWRDLYLTGSTIYLGSAVISSVDGKVNLPPGSSIGGSILDQEYFRSIAVVGQTDIVADAGGNDVLNIASGSGISITTNASTDTLTFTNSGVTSAIAGTGISVNTASGAVTFTNSGVTGLVQGAGISVSAATGNITVANTGVLSVVTDPGSGITLDTTVPGVVRVTNSAPNTTQNLYRNIAVSGQVTLIAGDPLATLTLVNGNGINITTTPASDSITVTNTGVTSLAVSAPGLSITGSTGSLTLSNTGVTAISAGNGISTINTSTGTVVISNTRFGFTNIAVTGQNPIQADNTTDTFTLIAGDGVVLTTNDVNDSLTIDVNYVKGNVYSESSTVLVNAALGKIVGDIETGSLRTSATEIALGDGAGEANQGFAGVAIGRYAGGSSQGNRSTAVGFSAGSYSQAAYSLAVGDSAGNINQGTRSVALGTQAGQSNQGTAAVAIGYSAGVNNQPANSIIINASGVALNGSASGFYVNPVREVTGPQVLYYNPSDKEITWGPVPAGGSGGSGGGDFELNVAADDSTIRRIFNGETLKFVGASGISTATDGEGKVTITGPSLSTVANTGSYNDLLNLPSIPAAYSATSIDALSDVDTSTTPPTNGQSLVWSSVSSKWLPSTISGGGGSLQSRSTVGTSTTNLANGATGNITITGYKGYMLYKIQTSAASWVRIYTDSASRAADASRVEGSDPLPGSGVIAEVITTGSQTVLVSPGTIGFSNESSPSTNIEVAVTNKSGITTNITVTLTVVQLEA